MPRKDNYYREGYSTQIQKYISKGPHACGTGKTFVDILHVFLGNVQ